MTSIALGIFIIFIVYVMVWSIKNDGARSIGDQTGFIKMRRPSDGSARSGRRAAAAPPPAPPPTADSRPRPPQRRGI